MQTTAEQMAMADGAKRSAEDLANAFRELLAAGLTQGAALTVLHEVGEKELIGTTSMVAIEAAREAYAAGSDDDIEIDHNAIFSQADDGLWVSAWVHLTNEQAGISTPLPDELAGRLWFVSWVHGFADFKGVTMIDGVSFCAIEMKSLCEASEYFDTILDDDSAMLVESADASEAIARTATFLKEPSAKLMWIEDEADTELGFEYLSQESIQA